MGLFRSLIGWLFILGGFFRILLGLGLLFFGGLTFSAIDPITAIISQGESGLLAVIGVVYIIVGAFFIWLGRIIKGSGQKEIRI